MKNSDITIIIGVDNGYCPLYHESSIISALSQCDNIIIVCNEYYAYNFIKGNYEGFDNAKIIEANDINVFKKGLELCETKYVLFLSYKDSLSIDYIETMTDFINDNNEYNAYASFVYYKDNESNILDIEKLPKNKYRSEVLHKRIFNFFHKVNPLFFSSIIFKRDSIEEFPESKYYEYELLSNFLQNNNKIKVIEESLIYYTVDEERFDFWNDTYFEETKEYRDQYENFLKKVKTQKYNVGVLIVATNKYIEIAKEMLESANKYLLKDHNLTYFIFTDKPEEFNHYDNVKTIYQEHMIWPGMTLFRYSFFWNNRDVFKDMDYLIYIDADMIIKDEIGDEILGDLIGTSHPWMFGLAPPSIIYERRKKSSAYVEIYEGNHYYFGTFQGGSTNKFLEMCKILSEKIKEDIDNNIIAYCWDESHLNRYMIDHPPDVVLDLSYTFTESYLECSLEHMKYYKPKIIVIEKCNSDIRDNFTEQDLLNRIHLYYNKIFGNN